MTLVVILNSVLAVLIVGAIVALHTGAILTDGGRRRRPATRTLTAAHPIRPVPHSPQRASAGDAATQSRPAAA
jgi:hypothetical protein